MNLYYNYNVYAHRINRYSGMLTKETAKILSKWAKKVELNKQFHLPVLTPPWLRGSDP